jgi:site-specific recombinase XerD
MFYQIFKYTGIAAQHLDAPMVEQRSQYLSHRAALGATTRTLRIEAGYLLAIVKELPLEPDRMVSSAELEAAAHRWRMRAMARPHHTKDGLCGKRLFLMVARHWLTFLDRWQPPAPPPCPEAARLAEFINYLERERGLSPATIRDLRYGLAALLRVCCAPPRSLGDLTMADIERTLQQEAAQAGWSRISLRKHTDSLRVFLRYTESRGWSTPGLADALVLPCLFQGEHLPLGPTWEEVQRLLDAVQGDHPTAIRDRAILLLLTTYGLRAGEVCRLRLEDLDWEREQLTIRRSKQQSRLQTYPLARTVGDALLRYLKEARPACAHREVFITAIAPRRPITTSILWHIVGPRLRALQVSLRHVGPHALRHACATHLLAEGFTLKEIGDHLGHRTAEATAHYARVDLQGLREVADFDLGGLL